MAKFVVPDPERVPSVEAQAVGDYGTFPVALADTARTEEEWEQLIKGENLPLVIKDVRKVTNDIKGTALHAAFKKNGEPTPEDNSEQQPEPGAEAADGGEG